MTTFFNITEAMTDPDRFIPAELAKAWWKNPIAIAEADSTVPLNLLPTVLLGTFTTTSGASVSLTGLDLTPFRFLRFTIYNVSFTAAGVALAIQGRAVTPNSGTGGDTFFGSALIDLFDGSMQSTAQNYVLGGASNLASGYISVTSTTPATTTLTVSALTGTFDAGYVRVYGLK